MQRSSWVKSVVLLQFVLGLLFAGLSMFLLFLISSPATKQVPHSQASTLGLQIAVAIFAPVALLVMVSGYGMWKGRAWGWWWATVTDLCLVCVFVSSIVDDGWDNFDWEMAGFTLLPMVVLVFLFLPAVRNFYSRRGEPSMPPAAASVGRP